MTTPALEFSLEDLRREVRYACLQGPGDPKESEILDPYEFISQPPILRRLGMWIGAQLEPEVSRLMAVGVSALGLTLAAGLEVNVPVAFVESGRVLGEFSSGDVVAVVADLTKTGASTRATVEAVRSAGAKVDQLLVVWDRSLGALDALSELDIPMTVLMEEHAQQVAK